MNDDQPTVFQSRWALSYLRGPVSRQQIEKLMAPHKSAASPVVASAGSTVPAVAAPAPRFAAPPVELPGQASRPVLPPGIAEYFLPALVPAQKCVYRPALLGQSRVHFVDAKNGIDAWDPVTLIKLAGDAVPADPWTEADEWDESDVPQLMPDPQFPDAGFRELPQELTQKKSYTSWTKALKDHLYRDRKLVVFNCEELKATSKPGESEADFRLRLRQSAREERDRLVEKLRRKYETKVRTLEDKIARAAQKIEKEKSQKSTKTLNAAVNVGTGILGALFGRKKLSTTNVTRAGSVLKSATGMSAESADIRIAEQQYAELLQTHEELKSEVEHEAAQITAQLDTDLMKFGTLELAPRKADSAIDRIALLWLPYAEDAGGLITRAF